jgi:hypothetical protein
MLYTYTLSAQSENFYNITPQLWEPPESAVTCRV